MDEQRQSKIHSAEMVPDLSPSSSVLRPLHTHAAFTLAGSLILNGWQRLTHAAHVASAPSGDR